jgi:hypothetical protein
MKLIFAVSLAAAAALQFSQAHADDTHEVQPIKAELSQLPKADQEQQKKPGDELWRYFSAGFLVNSYSDQIVHKAEIRNGVVRVTDSQKVQVGIGLQAYYPLFLWPRLISYDNRVTWVKGSELSFGPYVGVAIGSDNIIDSFAIGLAYSQRRTFGGFRIGVGYAVDPKVQRLADDFKDGQAAPDGATQASLKDESTGALQIMVSFTPGW